MKNSIPALQNKIDEAIKKFSSELPAAPAELYEPVRYLLSIGGKRIRPLFVLLACNLFDEKTDEAIFPALAAELFHNFTLVHDDIMDNAPLRRNQLTVHSKWNSSIAILSGDVMLVKAYQLLHLNKLSSKNFEMIISAFNEMAIGVCEGQQWDLNYEQIHKILITQYFRMIELKTAILFAASMKIGALIGGSSKEDANILFEFGKNTGIAFQLQDDLLDVYGEEKKIGKQKGGDIIANKKTFLLLKAAELSNKNLYRKKELLQWISFMPANRKDAKKKVEAVKSIYDFLNIKKITEEEINSYHEKAIAVFESHDFRTVSAEKKKALIDFTTRLLCREK